MREVVRIGIELKPSVAKKMYSLKGTHTWNKTIENLLNERKLFILKESFGKKKAREYGDEHREIKTIQNPKSRIAKLAKK